MHIISYKCCVLLAGISLASATSLLGQVNRKDFTGAITQYDTTFNGIGPEVYVLPPPKSKMETLTDQYRVIDTENAIVKRKYMLQQLLEQYAQTTLEPIAPEVQQKERVRLEDWAATTNALVQRGNPTLAISILNTLAKEAIAQQHETQAEAMLERAVAISEQAGQPSDQQVLLKNLLALYLFNNNLAKANAIEELFYKEAQQRRSLQDQASSLIQQAEIDAFQKDFKLAETTIIRKAIPLLNRSKDYRGKILAWIKLAEIYTSNRQYTEAQWFLIQAQDLAKQKRIGQYDAIIEYMLGEAKYHQDNTKVARQELENALKLAQESDNTYIEILSTQRLGEISLKQNRIAEAEQFLNAYWALRNKLF